MATTTGQSLNMCSIELIRKILISFFPETIESVEQLG
jgi:hypothetical protein